MLEQGGCIDSRRSGQTSPPINQAEGYDYSQVGGYFITVVTQNRTSRFGEIVDGDMQLNDAGRMVQAVWDAIAGHYRGVQTDAFVIMSNHIHGIIILVGSGDMGHPRGVSISVGADEGGHPRGGAPTGVIRGSRREVDQVLALPDIVHRFKSLTTNRYLAGVKNLGWPEVSGRLWQRNYYEHIIRHERSLNLIREYIENNPGQWEYDRENPDGVSFQG